MTLDNYKQLDPFGHAISSEVNIILLMLLTKQAGINQWNTQQAMFSRNDANFMAAGKICKFVDVNRIILFDDLLFSNKILTNTTKLNNEIITSVLS